jgi:hypothetical protein
MVAFSRLFFCSFCEPDDFIDTLLDFDDPEFFELARLFLSESECVFFLIHCGLEVMRAQPILGLRLTEVILAEDDALDFSHHDFIISVLALFNFFQPTGG